MSQPWTYLQYRYGESCKSPQMDHFQKAVNELYNENIPGMTKGDYEEHGAISLRCGYDDGPMYVLEITRSGKATWEEWADQDYEIAIVEPITVTGIRDDKALILLYQLSCGEIESLKSFFKVK